MKVKFQADADLNQTILQGTIRRELSIDFRTAYEAGLSGLSDPEVLAIASGDGRILVTHDQKTMPRHFGEFIIAQTSPGVLVVPQHFSISSMIDELILIWSITEANEWINRICYLPL
ncbi:MAG: DUF5615 family PIN-like protein [Candidatus Latescibacterota bacterium]|jgi:predicted nuclease of predicted toxin-antitoxin system